MMAKFGDPGTVVDADVSDGGFMQWQAYHLGKEGLHMVYAMTETGLIMFTDTFAQIADLTDAPIPVEISQ